MKYRVPPVNLYSYRCFLAFVLMHELYGICEEVRKCRG